MQSTFLNETAAEHFSDLLVLFHIVLRIQGPFSMHSIKNRDAESNWHQGLVIVSNRRRSVSSFLNYIYSGAAVGITDGWKAQHWHVLVMVALGFHKVDKDQSNIFNLTPLLRGHTWAQHSPATVLDNHTISSKSIQGSTLMTLEVND